MFDRPGRIRLLYIVMGMLLVVGVVPLSLAGWLLSDRTAVELGSVERRYQAQLVQDKARQIELYGQRYRDVVTGLAQAFELAGGVRVLNEAGSDARLRKALTGDPNLIALFIKAVQQQSSSKSEAELLDAGLPVVFVVDNEGRAVAHPDERVAYSQKPMTDLKVVQDWQETGRQVQSALAPFTVERDGHVIEMIGSYA